MSFLAHANPEMPDVRSVSLQRLTRRVLWLALAVLLLTSVHHAYGAYIYNTSWRLHVLFVSGLTAAALLGSFRILQKSSANPSGRFAFWVFAAITLAIPVGLIGLFEGGYNHALKNALYFAGASTAVMHRHFPPPKYELPNDVFFETTGVLQFLVGVVTAHRLFSLVREVWRRRANPDQARAAA